MAVDKAIIEADVLVIGGGSAGAMAAIRAKEMNPGQRVVVFEKGDAKYSGCIARGMDALNIVAVPGISTPEEYLESTRLACEGVVDDGEIIRYVYEREAAPAVIKNLKKMLWDNRCRGLRDLCPYKKKKFRFEELMKICSGKVEGHERIDSPMKVFVDRWERNMKEMYGPFVDKEVEVEGKVSSYKTIYRKGNEHIKMLIYDTMVREAASRLDPRPTRKLWIRMKLSEYDELAGEEKVRIDDTIRFRGKCVFDTHFYDYWAVDLKELKVVRKGEGDVITVLAP